MILKLLRNILIGNNDVKELCVYADSSWKDKIATFSYVDEHNKVFYVTKKFTCESSVVAECYAVQAALINGLKTAHDNGYTHLIIYTDLKILEKINDCKFKKFKRTGKGLTTKLFNLIEFYINLYQYDVDVTIVYMDHKKEPHLRLVDLLAYRQIQGIQLNKYKADVFLTLKSWSIQEIVFETFD